MAAELDESTRRVIEAFDRLSGRLNTEEEKKEEAARKAYEKMMGLANATGAVADVFITFNKEIYNGKSANQAASASIHKLSDAVKVASAAFLMFAPGGIIIKGVVAALALLTSKLIESGALVSDQAEEVYKAYQQLAKTGATGAGAMQDVFDGLQKVGLGTEKFAGYIKLVTDNAEDLAQFGGTVNKGRKIFDSTIESFSENQRIQMELLVGGREEQAAATMLLVKQQRLLTAGTKSQMDVSSAAVERYVKETDALTRITGLNREQQQKILDEAMKEDMFSSFIDEVQDGSEKGAAQAKRAFDALSVVETNYGKETAKGLRDSITNFLGTSKENEKFFMTYGEGGRRLINTLRDVNATEEDIGAAMKEMAISGKRTGKQMRAVTQMGVAGDTFIRNEERRRSEANANKDFAKMLSDARREREKIENDPDALKQAKAENDARQTQLDNQRKLNLLMPAYIEGLDKATGANRTAMDSLTNAALSAAEALGIIGDGKKVKKSAPVQEAEKVTAEARAAAKPLHDRIDTLDKQIDEDIKRLTEAKRAAKSLEEMRPLEEKIRQATEERAKVADDLLAQDKLISEAGRKEKAIRQTTTGTLGEVNRLQRTINQEKERLASLNEKRYNLERAIEKPGTDPYYRTPQQLEAGRKTLVELKESIEKTQKSLTSQESELGEMKKKIAPATTGKAPTVSGVTSTSDDYLKKLAATESGHLGRTAQPPVDKNTGKRASSASGLFQFTDDTWADTVKQMGKNYTPQDRFDPQKSKEVAAYFTEQNKKQLTKSMGSDYQPNDTDLYMAHFLGAGGASSFLKAMKENPGRNAADVAEGEQVVANPNIFFEGFKSFKETPIENLRKRTLAEVYEMMDKKLGNSAQQIAQGKAHEDVLKLAGGGIVRASSGGTSALLAEGGLNEAVVPLPDGKSIPLKMSDNSGVSDKILAVAQVLNPTTRILASIWQAWNSTKTEAKADDSASKNKLVPFDTPAPDNTNIKTAMKEALFESNVEVISKLNELISVQKGTNSISEKMLRYAQN